ncbi:hypothetical protein [Catellatospora sp. NPDC049133]|uniref:hypothetical protein n=1 Tax=Catellatospora sp. NPDC049133 TaxID=3155499 RepID=UPI0033E6D693
MTTSLAPVPATGLQKLWSTRLWIGETDIGIRPSAVDELARPAEVAVTEYGPDLILTDPTDAASTLAAAMQAASGAPAGRVRLRVQLCRAGYSVGLAYPTGAWAAWCVLATAGGSVDADSGMLSLHDPRAGCAAVGVPGLPWGRPITARPAPGLTVVHPGWLAYSITPVDAGHTILLLSADIAVGLPETDRR